MTDPRDPGRCLRPRCIDGRRPELAAIAGRRSLHPPGGDEAIYLAAGELAWFDGSTALSRHFIWRQARQSLIGPGTRRLVLISEFVDGIDDAVADAVTQSLEQGAGCLLGARTIVHRLDADRPTAELGLDVPSIQFVDSRRAERSSK